MQLKKHASIVANALQMHAAVVLTEVKPYNMKRLVEAHVNTIVPGRQLFLPSLLMDLRPQRNPVNMHGQPMPVMAQCMILFHLRKQSLNDLSAQPIAQLLNSSYPTINRAVKWLADNHFVDLTPSREKCIRFIRHGRDLWNQALPLMQNPIERLMHTDHNLNAPWSGEKALAQRTMLAEPPICSWAISAAQARQTEHLHKQFGEHTVEIWRYNPLLLTDNDIVDDLSLYLSLRDNDDERVQKELNHLLQNISW